MTFRTLEVPFKEIGTPSLARDGAWVAVPGNPRGTSRDIFLMNTASGEPRQVTTDSSAFMGSAHLSPDGSQIAYDRADKGFTRPEIAVMSSLGGFSKRIAGIGFYPRWSPDGRRVAYILTPEWGSSSGKMEYRSVMPNGSDDRLEFVSDKLVSASYSWSPEGSAIVFPKQLGAQNIELFIHDLAAGTERQITSMIEARNHADNTAYAAEKALREFGEKVPAEVKSDIEAKVAEVPSAAQGEDVETIKSATEALGQAIQKIGASVYEQNPSAGTSQAPAGGEAGSSSSGSSGEAGPDVIDGEVKE